MRNLGNLLVKLKVLKISDKIRYQNGTMKTAELRHKMQRCMQDHAAVFRDGPVLKEGVEKMLSICQEFENVKVFDK